MGQCVSMLMLLIWKHSSKTTHTVCPPSGGMSGYERNHQCVYVLNPISYNASLKWQHLKHWLNVLDKFQLHMYNWNMWYILFIYKMEILCLRYF